MIPNLLISGPAGAGKSQVAADALRERSGPWVLADFTALWAALLGLERNEDGVYPTRVSGPLLPLVEHMRREVIQESVRRDIGVIATNSDGTPQRRQALLKMLGPGSTEWVMDPGRVEVSKRLASHNGGILTDDCQSAIGRWYGNLG